MNLFFELELNDFKNLLTADLDGSGHINYCSVADPDLISGIRCLFDPWIRDPGWLKKSGSGMNNPDHISESLETSFWG